MISSGDDHDIWLDLDSGNAVTCFKNAPESPTSDRRLP